MIEKIHYLVGPNGTGKTRALDRLCTANGGFFIPKQRALVQNNQFSEDNVKLFITKFKQHSKTSPEQLAMALLREKSKLRYTVFAILSRKLGRNFSVEIVDRTQNFKITSGLDSVSYEEVSIPRYGLEGESSGLRELLVLLTLIHSGLSTKFFIDEPELSLHPEAQRFLKNEIISLSEAKGCEFWLATHSPIFFSPESIIELQQATFFSNPQKSVGNKPDFESISEGQKKHLNKSLLRLDTEKWLLVHSKAAVFCEGFRDKAIFKTVLNKAGIDLSRYDYSWVETGGKDDFSTLHLLCKAISKPAYFIGDLDCLIESKLLDKYDDNEVMKTEISGLATNIGDYISTNIRSVLGDLTNILNSIPNTDIESRDIDKVIFPHLTRIKKKSDNSKSLTLELFNKYPEVLKSIINNSKINPKIDLLNASTQKSIEIFRKVGFFIIPTGTLETYYSSQPVSPDDDKEKILLFDQELEILESEDTNITIARYKSLIDFITSIVINTFDAESFMRDELIKILAKIQAIILEEKPSDTGSLNNNSKYTSLKVSDLIVFTNIDWKESHFTLKGKSVDDFNPKFEFVLSSEKGITSLDTINFNKEDRVQQCVE
ncbi:MAG TPA: AAA family ATPase [Saprospiraceae bacterium]|jgi:predicted ATPase|nr:AAA family ATPase [Saprospiraceae bacterium]HMT72023.1 AAA family ATPase [Saprospiraceae bacterium]